MLNAACHDQTVTFQLLLASRAAEQEQQEARSENAPGRASIIQQLTGTARRI